MPGRAPPRRAAALAALALLAAAGSALGPRPAAATKWTWFVYMLADNDLEQFGLMDMEEIMAGMSAEPPGCVSAACGAACPAGTVATYSAACPGGAAPRCCPPEAYPDVLLLVDRGSGQAASYVAGAAPHGDYSLLTTEWTTAKELLALPGGQWQQLKDHAELDLASPAVLADFLRRGLQRFPPSADRKYMLVFWDHGSGWWGYGVDHTCGVVDAYSSSRGCDMLTMRKLAQGLSDGLVHPDSGAAVKLDIIGFDACLMSMYEVASTLAPHAHHLLASELLEPGHGWDYAAPLAATTAAGGALGSAGLARAVIDGYLQQARPVQGSGRAPPPACARVRAGRAPRACCGRPHPRPPAARRRAQAAAYETSGLTLALVDLGVAGGALEAGVAGLAAYLARQLAADPAYAMLLLRRRAALGKISGAEENVDLGALLAGLRGLDGSPALAAALAPALDAYNGSVAAFDRDAELADGSGVAIYFPSSAAALSPAYAGFTAADPTALSGWAAFLDAMYAATAAYTSDPLLADFGFEEASAAPYLAVSTGSWVTHGTLTNHMGLTSALLYGFRSPSNTQLAVGAWSGYLFGLLQDVSPGDGAVDGLALAHVDEARVLAPDRSVAQLILQAKARRAAPRRAAPRRAPPPPAWVFYAASCTAAAADMKRGVLKYVYDTAGANATLQLFVSSTGSSWGEVPPAQGGVVVPYMGSYALDGGGAAGAGGRPGASFGYADCLKWGYRDAIRLAAFDATQAADILGLDLARDMETQLLVTSIDGEVAGLPGFFGPAQKTLAGCQCSQAWPYNASDGTVTVVRGACINPGADPRGAWCRYAPDSCTNASGARAGPADRAGRLPRARGRNSHAAAARRLRAAAASAEWDYCAPTVTLSGCRCHPSWALGGETHYGSCASDGDPRGSWCVVDRASCPGPHRAHRFGAEHAINATVGGGAATLTGLDFDFCQTTTVNGCHCRNAWAYAGDTHAGTCRQGLAGGGALPGFSAATPWCFVDGVDGGTCAGSGYVGGHMVDICTPEGGRVAVSGAACELPASYGGALMYDCLAYNLTAPGGAAAAAAPWCFTNATAGAQEACAPWSCGAAVRRACPPFDPAAPPPDAALPGWAAPACLEALCSARQALANISQCAATDGPADRAALAGAYSYLAASPAFGALLAGATGAASLGAHCAAASGELCVDALLDPACPALYRAGNRWFMDATPAGLCDTGCLTALCRLQEAAKASVQGTPSWEQHVAAARGFSPPGTVCADAALETLVRWTLMAEMDRSCGWPGPASLACNRLLSEPQLCAAETALTALAGDVSDAVPPGGRYAPSSACAWTVSTPNLPFITLNFTTFDTEPLYDVLTVEDSDGVIGMFSGDALPPALSTDTGVLRLRFVSDSSLQRGGFAASYSASASPQVALPACGAREKLVQVVLRSRAYGAELSWLVTSRSSIAALNPPSALNIVMAGGLLPAALRSKVPRGVAAVADGEYGDYRSYYSYACLRLGEYSLHLYDSYGDGWDGGRLSLTQMLSASSGCQLLSATTAAADVSLPFTITVRLRAREPGRTGAGVVPRARCRAPPLTAAAPPLLPQEDADTSSAACASLVSAGAAESWYAEAGIVVRGEHTGSFNLAKQRKVKEALALLLDVDAAGVSIQELANASAADLAATAWGNRSAAQATGVGGGGGGGDGGGAPIGRVLLAAAQRGAPPAAPPAGSVQALLHEQGAWQGPAPEAGGGGRREALRRLARPVSELVASGALDAGQRQLQQVADQLREQERGGPTAAPPAPGAWPLEPECAEPGQCQPGAVCAAACAGPAGRRLQQLLTLSQEGDWLDADAAPAPAAAGGASVAAVLAAQPLQAPGGAGAGGQGAARVKHVVLSASFRDAFASSADGSGGTGGGSGGGAQTAAAVPKPSAADTAPAPGAAAAAGGAATAGSAVAVFDAIRPQRSMLGQDLGGGGGGARPLQREARATGRAGGGRAASVAAADAAALVGAPRVRPDHSRPRPKPVTPRRSAKGGAASGGGAAAHLGQPARTGRALREAAGGGGALLLVARVSGYASQAAAGQAAAALSRLVANGTLRSTLAAQGWADVELGLAFTRTGERAGPPAARPWRTIIIAAAAAGGGALLLALAGALWYARRARAAGAAAVPAAGPGAGRGHARMSAPPGLLAYGGAGAAALPAFGAPAPGGGAGGGAYGRARSNTSPPPAFRAGGVCSPSDVHAAVQANPFAPPVQQARQWQQPQHGAGPRAQPWVGGGGGGGGGPPAQQAPPDLTAVEAFTAPRSAAASVVQHQTRGGRASHASLL
ncbi:hypothetical protein HT031_000187 [Scenedesmus sp. PABB004]|nr:hypothetical protein HT031_000187 [Scenedesmus sp. PABB004]